MAVDLALGFKLTLVSLVYYPSPIPIHRSSRSALRAGVLFRKQLETLLLEFE